MAVSLTTVWRNMLLCNGMFGDRYHPNIGIQDVHPYAHGISGFSALNFRIPSTGSFATAPPAPTAVTWQTNWPYVISAGKTGEKFGPFLPAISANFHRHHCNAF